MPIQEQRMIFAGRELENQCTLHLPEHLLKGLLHPSIENQQFFLQGLDGTWIAIPTFHLSCQSLHPSEWKNCDIGGIIFYDSYAKGSLRIRPGYIYVQNPSTIQIVGSKEGQIHGNLFKKLIEAEPSQTQLLCAGFGRRIGQKWAFDSMTLNQKQKNWTLLIDFKQFLQKVQYYSFLAIASFFLFLFALTFIMDRQKKRQDNRKIKMDNQSIAYSTKSGKAKDKHCTDCKGKLISGRNWSRHKREQNHEQFQICSGDPDCQYCQDFATLQQTISGKGKHPYKPCSQCGKNTRTDHLSKENQCNVCVQGKVSNRSVINFGASRSTTGKRLHCTLQDNIAIPQIEQLSLEEDKQQQQLEQQQQSEIEVTQPKRQALLEDFVAKLPQYSNKLVFLQESAPQVKENVFQQQIIIQTQDQRDQQVIHELNEILTRDQAMEAKVGKFINLLPSLTQEMLIRHINQEKNVYPVVYEVVYAIQDQIEDRTAEEATTIALLAILMGGKNWNYLSEMFNHISSENTKVIKSRLRVLLKRHYSNELADWVSDNCTHLKEHQLQLLRYLTEFATPQPHNILTVSSVVDMSGKVDEFVLITDIFLRHSRAKLFLQCVSAHKQQSIEYKQYLFITRELQSDKNKYLLEQNKAILLDLPLSEWTEAIHSWQASILIEDKASIQLCLDELQNKYQSLCEELKVDLKKQDLRFKNTFHTASVGPNNLQFALAQYAAGSLQKYPRQIWTVPSGQGKSRIAATLALILLYLNVTKKVHMIFNNSRLMKRDMVEFQSYWQLANLVPNIVYHQGIDFHVDPNDILIFDEADVHIFDNTDKFKALTTNKRCICFTATPDNNDKQGIEGQVVETLGLMKFDYGFQHKGIPKLDKTIKFHDKQAIISFILEETKHRPMLVYCKADFLVIFEGIAFINADDGLNDEIFRKLDSKTAESYPLLVATEVTSMRGVDYRAASTGITLLLLASFPNQREANQGLNRVGRYADECQRVISEGLPLIDPKAEVAYYSKLLAFCNDNIGIKVQVNNQVSKQSKGTSAFANTKRGQQLLKNNQVLDTFFKKKE